jgi:type IV pilus assembly protein PilA
MFQRFQELKEKQEGGFTLIELLVVILIIAILAAIAIPVFLNQRKKGWTAQVQSAVKNAATAEESYSTGNNGVYADTLAKLTSEGFRYSSADVTPSVIYPAAGNVTATDGYCLKALSAHDATITWYYQSSVGAPSTTACTGP